MLYVNFYVKALCAKALRAKALRAKALQFQKQVEQNLVIFLRGIGVICDTERSKWLDITRDIA